MPTVRIPTTLRPLVGGASSLVVEGESVGQILDTLVAAHPGIGERLFDDGGKLRRFVNIFVEEEDIRYADGLDTKVLDRQTVSILPAVAGG